jgi:hypothetical protein
MFLIDMHCFMNTNRVHTAHSGWMLICRRQLSFYLAEERSKYDFIMHLQYQKGMSNMGYIEALGSPANHATPV